MIEMKTQFFIIIILFSVPVFGQNKAFFNAIHNTHWAQTSYIEDIIRTKSPYKSQNKLAMIVELDFDSSSIIGDSLFVGAPSIHEGTSFYLYFRQGQIKTSLPTDIKDYSTETNFYELGYNITDSDTSLVLYRYDKNKKIIRESEIQ